MNDAQSILRTIALGVCPTLEACGQPELAQTLRRAIAVSADKREDRSISAYFEPDTAARLLGYAHTEIDRLTACVAERDAKIAELVGEARGACL